MRAIGIVFSLLLCVLGTASAHSYVASPPSRSRQDQTWRGETKGPCDSVNVQSPRQTVARGSTIPVQWPRNNHPGGIIRMAWAKSSASSDPLSFDQGVVSYSCHETPCNEANQCNNVLSDSCTPCQRNVQVPNWLTDGTYTLQWVWYGGGFGLEPYYSCMDFDVRGGKTVSQKTNPVFIPGDQVSSNSCGICVGCQTSFRNGPSLSQLAQGPIISNPTNLPTTPPTNPTKLPTNSPTTSPMLPTAVPSTSCALPAVSRDFTGFICPRGDCCDRIAPVVSGHIYPYHQTAPGTLCKTGRLVAISECATTCVCADNILPGNPTLAPSDSAPTVSDPTIPTVNPSEAAIIPNPTSASNPSAEIICPDSYTGYQCIAGDCCPRMRQCVNGQAYPTIQTAPGTLCKAGRQVLIAECSAVSCPN